MIFRVKCFLGRSWSFYKCKEMNSLEEHCGEQVLFGYLMKQKADIIFVCFPKTPQRLMSPWIRCQNTRWTWFIFTVISSSVSSCWSRWNTPSATWISRESAATSPLRYTHKQTIMQRLLCITFMSYKHSLQHLSSSLKVTHINTHRCSNIFQHRLFEKG